MFHKARAEQTVEISVKLNDAERLQFAKVAMARNLTSEQLLVRILKRQFSHHERLLLINDLGADLLGRIIKESNAILRKRCKPKP